jgi:glycosyltransferase involved in cell wall biosynthesis
VWGYEAGGFGAIYLELDAVKHRFSICIPVWEQHGFGLQYLKDLIHSIQIQSFQNWEVIISDHSEDDEIFRYVFNLGFDDDLKYNKIWYDKCDKNRGNGVVNLNNALKMAKGEIIKIMFQDDFMFDRRCLEKFDEAFKYKNNKWAVCGCNHTRDGLNFERFIIPRWNDKLLEGVNTISSPSVLAFRNENIEMFDENLTMLMDVEYYYRMDKKHGLPVVIEDCLVTNRCHDNQISSRYSGNLEEEIKYCKKKHYETNI